MTEQNQQRAAAGDAAEPDAVPPPHRGPIPDLGFFAGAPQPGGSTVGGSSAPSQFGGAPAPSQFGGVPAPSQFGGVPAQSQFGGAPAQSQFGGVPGQFGGAAPTPAFPGVPGVPPGARPAQGPLAALRSTPGGRWALRVGVGVAIAVVLGMVGVGRLAFLDLFDKEVKAPSSLAGLAPADQAVIDVLDRQMSTYGDALGVDFEIAAYGDGLSPLLFIGAAYDDETPDPGEVAGVLGSSGGRNTQMVGENTCTEVEREAVVMCLRVDDGTMIAVLSSGRSMQDISTITDEAWDAQ